jgi:EmrB/QacA subfamily drug resistance transporter
MTSSDAPPTPPSRRAATEPRSGSVASTPAASDRIEPWVWRISAIVILGSIMSILDTTIVNVALTSLGRELHSSIADVQWVVTGYLLALAAVIPVAGWAARRFGPKSVYLTSLVLFTGGSMLCGIATSMTELIFFRVLQGIGGGMILPVAQLIMASAAGPKRMGRVMSVIAVPAMLAPILGPALGGLILDSTTWRWIFFVNVPVGAIALVTAWRGLPRSAPQAAGKLDVVGLLLLATGIPAVTYGLAEVGATGGFPLTRVVIPIAAGVALVIAFCINALHVQRPLLDLRLYKRSAFSAASIAIFCFGAALFGAMILMPLYYQQVRHENVLATGLLMGPGGIGAALSMPFAGRFTDRFGGGPLALFGVFILTLGTIPFALIGAHTSIVWLSFAMFVRGIGIGFAFIPAMTAAYTALRPEELSDATPQLNVLQRVGGSIGVAVLAVVLQRSIVAHGGSHATLAGISSGYATAYWWAVAISAIAIVPSIVLLRSERRTAAARRLEAAAPAAVTGDAAEPAVLDAVGA